MRKEKAAGTGEEQKAKRPFVRGLLDGVPIGLGYFSVAFAFGIFCVNAGLFPLQALFISLANVTSAGQLAAVPIIVSGGTLFELALSQFVINLRYSLMSVTLSQRFDDTVTLPHRFLVAFVNTDEVFAVAASQKDPVGKNYMYGLILLPYLGWSAGTIVGALAGSLLPASVVAALGIAIYGMFIAILVPKCRKSLPVLFCVLIAAGLSCLFYYLPPFNRVPSGFAVIICAVVPSVIMALAAPVGKEGRP